MMNKSQQNILPLALVSFFLAFNYFILKALKETLLLTAQDAGAEAIPFVKVWLLFPVSMIFLGAFTWMATRISLRFALVAIISFFLSTYALFTFVCYPFRENLHLHTLADSLQRVLPEGWSGLVAVVRYWSFSLFYVTAECWSTMIYSVVFWGYANAVTSLSEAKKYYPYLTLAGTTSALVAGPLTIFLTGDYYYKLFSPHTNNFDLSLYSLTGVVLFCGISALGIFLKYCPSAPDIDSSTGDKGGVWRSFANVFQSKYLIYLALIGFTYNFVINLSDVIWKNEVLALYPDPRDFTSYLSYVTFLTGIISTLFTLFLCRQSLQLYGWTKTALLTPIITLITGMFFFFAILLSDYNLMNITLPTIAFLGSLHICFSCGGKYTLFEPMKEMAFIPLSNSDKLYGKAAIDGVGTRLGKNGSSLAYLLLLTLLPSISACTFYIGILVLVMIALCIKSVLYLGKKIEAQSV